MNPDQDTALLGRLQQGDSNALGRLYERYHDRLLRFSARLTNDGRTAEDIAQNVFITLQVNAATIRDGKALQSWLFTVVRHASIEEVRKQRMESFNDEEVWDGAPPDEVLQRTERREMIETALQRLHRPYREVIILREYEEMSYAEIADVTGTTISSVKSRLFKARKALIELLKPYL